MEDNHDTRKDELEDLAGSSDPMLMADPVALTKKGISLMNADKDEEALETFGTVLELFPNYELALENRCHVLVKLGRGMESLECLDYALKINQDKESLIESKALVLGTLGRYDEALVLYDKILNKTADKALYALSQKANCLFSLENYSEALKILDQILAAKRDDPELFFKKGCALLHTGKPRTALKSFDTALKLDSTMIKAINYKGAAYSTMNKL